MHVVLTLATGNDSTGVTHAATGRSRTASDETDDGLRARTSLVVPLEVFSSLLLHRATNLADNDDT